MASPDSAIPSLHMPLSSDNGFNSPADL